MEATSSLRKTSGDLLKMAISGQFDYIVHGANCFNTMKSGIAAQIASQYPPAVQADNTTQWGDKSKLGRCTMAQVWGEGEHIFTIVNAYTQYTYSRLGDVFEYSAFEKFLKSFETFLRDSYHKEKHRVGFPYIGCGLAGGNKERIVTMLETFADACKDIATVSLVNYDGKQEEKF